MDDPQDAPSLLGGDLIYLPPAPISAQTVLLTNPLH